MSLFHLHKRKRNAGRALHSYPAPIRSLRIIDRAVYAAGLLAIFMMLPQIQLIYTEKNAAGFAPITWLMLAVLNIPWIVYGLAHKEKPIVLVYSLWLVVNSIIFAGAVLY